MLRSERGIALLEVIIALTLLTVSGLSMIAVIASGLETQRQVRTHEHELQAASRVLSAYALLTRDDLDLRLGRRAEGEFQVGLQRPEPALYRVGISPGDAPDLELLVTVLYRPPIR
jgi:type II secretory pathway pseudopilin PulG